MMDDDLMERCGGDLREFERCCVESLVPMHIGAEKVRYEDDGEITLSDVAKLPVLN